MAGRSVNGLAVGTDTFDIAELWHNISSMLNDDFELELHIITFNLDNNQNFKSTMLE